MVFELLLSVLFAQPAVGSMTSAKEEVGRLATALHQRIELTPALANEIVYVRSIGAEPTVELNALASALHATVVPESGGISVKRTKEDETGILRVRTEERMKWIAASKDRLEAFRKLRLRSGMTPSAIEGEVDRELHQFNEIVDGTSHGLVEEFSVHSFMPDSEMLLGLIDRIGEKAIGEVPVGSIWTFESPVGPGTRPLPACADLVQTYSAAVQNLSSVKLSPYADSQLRGQGISLLIAQAHSNAPVQLAKIRLSISPFPSGIDFRMDLYDGLGRLLEYADFGASAKRPFLSTIELQRAATQGKEDEQVSLSPEALQVAMMALSKRLVSAPECLTAPNRDEPLTLLVKDAVAAMTAGETQKCVVADVPDSFLLQAARCVDKDALDVTGFQRLIDEADDYERLDTHTAAVWRPSDPEYVEAVRADRSRLGRFAQRLISDQGARLRTLSKLYHESFPAVWYWTPSWSDATDNLVGRDPYEVELPAEIYSIIGAISDGAWESLESGTTITANRLGIVPELEHLFTDAYLDVKRNNGPVVDLYRHPEELYTEENPGSTPITIRTTKKPAVTVWTPKEKESPYWMPYGQLFHQFIRFQYEDPLTGALTSTRDQFESKCLGALSFRTGTQTDETLRIGLPGGYYIDTHLSTEYGDKGKVMTFADLSQADKDEAWKFACDTAHEQAESLRRAISSISTKAQPPAQSRIPPH